MPALAIRKGLRVWLPVFAAYGGALALERHGVFSASHGSDVALYQRYAAEIASGHAPYRDFFFEYPPGALVPIMLAEPFHSYATAFKVEMAVVGAGVLVAASACLRRRALRQRLASLLVIALAPVLVGSVFVNRLDIWAAFLATVGLALFVRGRVASSFAAMAAGVVTKLFPLAAIPSLAVYVWRRHGAAAWKRATATFVAVALAAVLPFAVLGPGGLRFSFTIQLTRHLQTESLGGAILLVAGRLGLYQPKIATGNPGSLDLFGTLPNIVATVSLIVVVGLVAWTGWALVTGRNDERRAVTAAVAAVAAYVAFNKVLSPQYLLWLIPLVPLAPCDGRRFRGSAALIALFVAALVFTQIEFDHDYQEIQRLGPVVWILLLRDLALVAVAGLLLRASRPSPANPHPPAHADEQRADRRPPSNRLLHP